MMERCFGCVNDDWIERPDNKFERSSVSGLDRDLVIVSSASSKRATAAATPRSTAMRRSGRSKIWEELGWRIYLC